MTQAIQFTPEYLEQIFPKHFTLYPHSLLYIAQFMSRYSHSLFSIFLLPNTPVAPSQAALFEIRVFYAFFADVLMASNSHSESSRAKVLLLLHELAAYEYLQTFDRTGEADRLTEVASDRYSEYVKRGDNRFCLYQWHYNFLVAAQHNPIPDYAKTIYIVDAYVFQEVADRIHKFVSYFEGRLNPVLAAVTSLTNLTDNEMMALLAKHL